MKPIRVLICEDDTDDFELLVRELRRGGFDPRYERVQTAADFRRALETGDWELVLSDYSMPSFTALDALAVMVEVGPDIPFIIVSGTIGDEPAVLALKSGAADFIVKQNLARLVPAMERELRDSVIRRERRDALRALRHAVLARDEFLSIASHELKTPLTSLQIQVQSLERMGRDRPELPVGEEKIQSKVQVILRQTKRLTALINSLLDVTRIAGGRLDLVREMVSLDELAVEVAGRVAPAATASSSAAAPPEIQVTAPEQIQGWWDRMRIEMVVGNLLSNAVKYGEGRPIDVTVGRGPGGAELVVRDRGIGIPAAELTRIFERFERAVPERHDGGLGLGLWIARQIVEAHGGTLTVVSREGEGSQFMVSLPFEEQPARQPGRTAIAAGRP